MKKRNKLLAALAIVLAFMIGFAAGIALDYTPVENAKISGTIAAVNNHGNSRSADSEIQLKTRLLSDSALQESVKAYMDFFYVRIANLENNINFAVKEARSVAAFRINNANQITALESYGKFLATVRKDLLFAVVACESPQETEPSLLTHSIVQANNIIAQMNYRSRAVLNFIIELDVFIQESRTSCPPGLKKAHDLLAYHEMVSSVILKDQVLQKFFEKKEIYAKDLKLAEPTDLMGIIKKDIESLKLKDHFGAKNLESITAETLKSPNRAETEATAWDVTKLQDFLESEALKVY